VTGREAERLRQAWADYGRASKEADRLRLRAVSVTRQLADSIRREL
jgi:hypothetical protein